MRRFTLLLPNTVLLVALMFLPVRVHGQGTATTPSLTDTLNFIKQQLEQVSLSSRYFIEGTGEVDLKGYEGYRALKYGVEEYRSFENSNVSYSACELSLTETQITKVNNVDQKGWGKEWRSSKTTVWGIKMPLSNMSVKGIKVVEYDPHEETRALVKERTAGSTLKWTTKNEGEKFVKLVLPMSGGQKMEMTKSVDGRTETAMSSEEDTYFVSAELANRLAKAFAHAMTLCGAKDDPF